MLIKHSSRAEELLFAHMDILLCIGLIWNDGGVFTYNYNSSCYFYLLLFPGFVEPFPYRFD